jgi:hypothetical protein
MDTPKSPVAAPVSSTEQLLAASRRRRMSGLAFSILAVLIYLFTIGTVLVGFGWVDFTSTDWQLFSSGSGLHIEASGSGMNDVNVVLLPAIAYVTFFVLPLLLLLPLLIAFAIRWKYPLRIVVFRPFNSAYERGVTKILSNYVAPHGHVITLADKHVAPPWNVRLPLFIGQVAIAHFSTRRIRSQSDIVRLEGKLCRRRALSMSWLLSFRKVFPIQTDDSVWRQCVAAALRGADLVLIDISSRSPNVAAEIRMSRDWGLEGRIAFMCHRDQIESSSTWLREELGEWPGPIFTFERKLVDAEGFSRHVAHLASKANARRQLADMSLKRPLVRVLALTLGLGSLVACGTAPYIFPEQTARWSPFDMQLLHAYVYRGSQDALARVYARSEGYTAVKLAEYTQASYSGVRTMGMLGLGRIGSESGVPHILQRWPGDSEDVVAEALGRIVEKRGVRALRAVLAEMRARNARFSDAIQDRVAKYGAELAARELPEMLGDSSEAVRFFAALASRDPMDPRALPVLLELVDWTTKPRQYVFATQTGTKEQTERLLQRYLETGTGVVSDLRPLEPWLRRGEGPAAEYAVRLAMKAADGQQLSGLARHLGDVPMPAYFEVLGNCGGSVPPDAALVLKSIPRGALVSTAWETRASECARLAGARELAERGDMEALTPTLRAARQTQFLTGRYLDENSNAVLSVLARTLPPRQELNLQPADFQTLSYSSFVSLLQLAVAMNDAQSIRSAVLAYGDYSAWLSQLAGLHLASAIPREWAPWLRTLQQGASSDEAKKRYASLLKGVDH